MVEKELWELTRQEKSLVHSELLRKSDMAEVFLAFAYSCDITALSEDLHDELLGGVLRQTTNKHRLTPRRALSCGWRGKVCSRVEERNRGNTITLCLNHHPSISYACFILLMTPGGRWSPTPLTLGETPLLLTSLLQATQMETCAHTHSYSQFINTNEPNMHVFRLQDETRAPKRKNELKLLRGHSANHWKTP